jgi:hypothetical protein
MDDASTECDRERLCLVPTLKLGKDISHLHRTVSSAIESRMIPFDISLRKGW